jgi:flavodoxin
MATAKGTLTLSRERTKLVDRIIGLLEKHIPAAEKALTRAIASDFIDRLDKDGDRIKNTMRNKRLVGQLDAIYNKFSTEGDGSGLLATVVKGMNQVIDFNAKYYTAFGTGDIQPINKQVKDAMGDWLGLTKRGAVQPNGYLDRILKDSPVLQDVKDMAMGAIVGQKGFFEAKKDLQEYLVAPPGRIGKMQQYFRNFVYDKFSVADRVAAKQYADKLRFDYAIYEGGLIKTSREFCKERNGKVFSRAEIAAFDPTEARPPGYDPFTDLGGYGCRHHLNWIPDAVAFALRPELRGMPKDPLPHPASTVEVMGQETPARQSPDVPMANVKAYQQKKFPISPGQRATVAKYGAAESKMRALNRDMQSFKRTIDVMSKRLESGNLSKEAQSDIQDTFNKAAAEYNKAYVKYVEQQQVKNAQNIKMRNDIVRDLSDSKVKITVQSKTLEGDTAFKSKAAQAIEFFRKAAAGYLEDFNIGIKMSRGGRSYASGLDIYMNPQRPTGVIVHELAHLLEEHNAIFKYAVEFLMRRTGKGPLRKLRDINRAYGSDELYKEGDFYSPYVGKIYTATARADKNYLGIQATEVVSMGLEKMYNDPIGFYRQDRDHFEFIYTLFFAR